MTMEDKMTTMTFDLDGYKVTRVLGVVRGITVRSRSLFGTRGGDLQTLVGGNITMFTELCGKRAPRHLKRWSITQRSEVRTRRLVSE